MQNRYFVDHKEIEIQWGRRKAEGMIAHWRFKGEDDSMWRLVLKAVKGRGAKEVLMNHIVFDVTQYKAV